MARAPGRSCGRLRAGEEGGIHQEEGQRRPERPVIGRLELALDDIADHDRIGTAQKIGGEKGAEAGNEDEDDPGDDSRHGQRQRHRQEGPALRGAEIEARLEIGTVEPLDGRIERQDHEGHVDIDESGDHREVVVKELQRLKRTEEGGEPDEIMEEGQAVIDEAIGAEHRDQGIGPDQQVDPEGQDDQQQQQGLYPR
jgi:hypothetical protein